MSAFQCVECLEAYTTVANKYLRRSICLVSVSYVVSVKRNSLP